MKVLVAEDDEVSRHILENMLTKWGYEVIPASNGDEVWEILQREDGPKIAILDWMMPGLTGVEICKRARSLDAVYIILLTARSLTNDISVGFENGADDNITKPFTPLELMSKLYIGEKVVGLQSNLAKKIREYGSSAEKDSDRRPLVTVCSYCRRIRNEEESWQKLETDVSSLLEERVTHSICPECYEKTLRDWQEKK